MTFPGFQAQQAAQQAQQAQQQAQQQAAQAAHRASQQAMQDSLRAGQQAQWGMHNSLPQYRYSQNSAGSAVGTIVRLVLTLLVLAIIVKVGLAVLSHFDPGWLANL